MLKEAQSMNTNTIRKVLRLFVITLTTSIILFTSNIVQAEPSYAKWGNIAVKETSKKYNASITDYRHMGSKKISDDTTEEIFKLILNKNNRKMGVVVTVTFNSDTNELRTIRYQETNP